MPASGRSSGTTRRPRHRPGRRSPWLRGLLFWRSGNRRTGRVPAGSAARSDGSKRSRRIKVEGSERPAGRRSAAVVLGVLLRLLGVVATAAGLCAIAYGSRWFLLHSRHFALHHVRVSPTRHVTESSILRRAAVPVGHNLFSIDLEQVLKNLRAEPWLAKVDVRRELPAVLAIDVTEHEPVAVLALDALYLVDAEGVVFKRAAAGEYAGLPIVTGVGRTAYLMEPAWARKQVRAALSAVARYRVNPDRPALGEAHIDRFAGVTLYTDQGVALRVGRGTDAELDTRLLRFDVVQQALKKSGEKPAVLFLDNRAHPDHVTVRLAAQTPR